MSLILVFSVWTRLELLLLLKKLVSLIEDIVEDFLDTYFVFVPPVQCKQK